MAASHSSVWRRTLVICRKVTIRRGNVCFKTWNLNIWHPTHEKKTTKTVYRWVETSPKKDQRESTQPTHRLFIQTSFSAFSSLPIFWRPTYGQNSKKKKSDISSLILHLPSGNLTYLWKITIFDGNIHYFYGHFQQLCEIILNYQRVNPINSH